MEPSSTPACLCDPKAVSFSSIMGDNTSCQTYCFGLLLKREEEQEEESALSALRHPEVETSAAVAVVIVVIASQN